MKFRPLDKPRPFVPDPKLDLTLVDYGKLHLDPNEMVSLVPEFGGDADVVAKNWGFYITPSINHRLRREGFRTALVRNLDRRYYVMVVGMTKIDEFQAYLDETQQVVVEWLDERK